MEKQIETFAGNTATAINQSIYDKKADELKSTGYTLFTKAHSIQPDGLWRVYHLFVNFKSHKSAIIYTEITKENVIDCCSVFYQE